MWTSFIPPARLLALRKLDAHYSTRLSLRLTSIALTLFSLIAFAASIPSWQSTFFHATGPIRGDWTDFLPLLPLTLIILTDLWTISHTIRRCHPPSPVISTSIAILIVTLLTPALVLAVVGSLFVHFQFSGAVTNDSGTITCSTAQNFLTRPCNPTLYTVGSLQLLGVVFGCMVWIVHVSFAMWGALDVRRNRERITKESSLERRRRRWREERGQRGRAQRRESQAGGARTGTGAYETYGWYR